MVRLNLKDNQKGIKIVMADLTEKRKVHHAEIPELNFRIYTQFWGYYF